MARNPSGVTVQAFGQRLEVVPRMVPMTRIVGLELICAPRRVFQDMMSRREAINVISR